MKINLDLSATELSSYLSSIKETERDLATTRLELSSTAEKLRIAFSEKRTAESNLEYSKRDVEGWKKEHDSVQKTLAEVRAATTFQYENVSADAMETSLLNLAAFLNNPQNKPAFALFHAAAKGNTLEVIRAVRTIAYMDLAPAKKLVERTLAPVVAPGT